MPEFNVKMEWTSPRGPNRGDYDCKEILDPKRFLLGLFPPYISLFLSAGSGILISLIILAAIDEVYQYSARHSDDLDRLIYQFADCEEIFLQGAIQRPGFPESRNWVYFQDAKRYVGIKARRVNEAGNDLVDVIK
jgi:hypothetical protein